IAAGMSHREASSVARSLLPDRIDDRAQDGCTSQFLDQDGKLTPPVRMLVHSPRDIGLLGQAEQVFHLCSEEIAGRAGHKAMDAGRNGFAEILARFVSAGP